MQKVPTGIKGFDKITYGGVPRGTVTLVLGPPKSGKTIFSAQFLMGGIIESNEPGVFITFSDTPESIIKNMGLFDWDVLDYMKKGLWEFVDVSFNLEESLEFSGDYDLEGLLIQIKMAIEKIKAKRIILDSINLLFQRYPNSEIIKSEIIRIKSWLESLSVTSIITNQLDEEIDEESCYNIANYTCDNVILLKNLLYKEPSRRTVEILKFQGNNFQKGKHLFSIEDRRGIFII